MKVAVSIPDRIFRAAERISKKKRMSRSQFYAQALEAYVEAESGDEITEQLNRVYSKISYGLEPGFERAALEVLRDERWK